MVDGKEREALIVLITEGQWRLYESQRLLSSLKKEAKERPKLKIKYRQY